MEAYTKLLAGLAQDHFGVNVELVVKTLMSKGKSSMVELKRFIGTELTLNEIKDALTVLIQQSIVDYETRTNAKNDTISVLYSLDKDELMHRLRTAQYTKLAKTLYGENGEQIATQFVKMGRLTVDTVVKYSAQAQKCESNTHGLRETFNNMVKDHLIIAVPPPKLVTIHPNGTTEVQEQDYTPFALPSASGESRKRGADTSNDQRAKRKKGEHGDAEEVEAEATSDALLRDFASSLGVLYRLNQRQFHIVLRNKQIAAHVAGRIDAVAGEIVAAMLKLTELETTSSADMVGKTSAVSLYAVSKALPKGTRYLQILCELGDGIVEREGVGQTGAYRINLVKAVSVLKSALLASIVHSRFGPQCCRMYRMVTEHKHLEERQLADMALMESKEARKMINQMIDAGFLDVQEVPRSVNRISSQTLFLLSHDLNRIVEITKDKIIGGIQNHMARKQSTISGNAKFLDKVKRQVGPAINELLDGSLLHSDPSTWPEDLRNRLSESDEQTVTKLHRTIVKLTAAMMCLDESLMILSDF